MTLVILWRMETMGRTDRKTDGDSCTNQTTHSHGAREKVGVNVPHRTTGRLPGCRSWKPTVSTCQRAIRINHFQQAEEHKDEENVNTVEEDQVGPHSREKRVERSPSIWDFGFSRPPAGEIRAARLTGWFFQPQRQTLVISWCAGQQLEQQGNEFKGLLWWWSQT